jgi:hypothetical protein
MTSRPYDPVARVLYSERTMTHDRIGAPDPPGPKFEFHVSRQARDRYRFTGEFFSWNGNVLFADFAASRAFAARMNEQRDLARHPESAVRPGELSAMGIIDEVLHALVALYRERKDPRAMLDALAWYEARLGGDELDHALLAFTEQFPPVEVHAGRSTAPEWLARSTAGTPHRAVALEELMMLWLANANPAFRRFTELFDDAPLAAASQYGTITAGLKDYFATRPKFGPANQNLLDVLRAPALAAPDSLEAQLAFIRDQWPDLIGGMLRRILVALDIYKEEEIAVWMRFHPHGPHFGAPQTLGDSSAAAVPRFQGEPEYERFSADLDWMPRTVMIAKSVFVWLDQLSRTYGRHIHRLDQIPDEELDLLARRGFNALWLIGLWERSRASQRIKQLTGNPEAAASAYSLWDYTIAQDLGGEPACHNLRDRALARGIRLASDMVPNHMGIDSRWVIEHPGWFLSRRESPFPSYRFEGPDLSGDGRVEIKIDDHYFDRSDAAVVFRRRDRWTGDVQYIYHGNDGTSFPWNDTAQLNYLLPEVREAVIQNILHVARLSPIIRFDAAMTLTKQHYQRLWFPQPGTGGAIPSRAEAGMTKAEFDAAMPVEFWREVVDRVAAEVPGTLLLAEAFWLLEGYFVRTLGMHRVYNSAFMNMLRDEENANYRSVIRNTLEFDPEVLKRYVNFMNNPDERTAVDQFGKGDKYFGVCTLMATLPGLPMFGHGQIEGYVERYGMEYRRAYHEETPDPWLVARHEREISPLLLRRALFAEVQDFALYDFFADDGHVNEDVFAYSNRFNGERALVVYHNRYADTRGWIRLSCGYAEKTPGGGRHIRQRSLGDALGLSHDAAMYVAARDSVTGLEYLYGARDLVEQGMRLQLGAYQCRVLLDFRDLREDAGHPWGALCDQLGGRGCSSLEDALHDLQLKPVHDAARRVLDVMLASKLSETAQRRTKPKPAPAKLRAEAPPRIAVVEEATARVRLLLERARLLASGDEEEVFGLPASAQWRGDLNKAAESFRRRLTAALKVPALEKQFARPWPRDARTVLPTLDGPPAAQVAVWNTVLAWAALLSLGELIDPADPESASARAFDALRLRGCLAEMFQAAGLHDEERWRAAARVRALAHAAWAPGAPPKATHPHFSWLLDPDVSWLIGVHEYEGVRYFIQEPFERLLWWMALPSLVRLAETPDAEKVRALEREIDERISAAKDAGFQLSGLFESGKRV